MNIKTCDHNFEDKTNVKKHVVGFHGEIEYSCDKCEKYFQLNNHLATNVTLEHDDLASLYSFEMYNSKPSEHFDFEEIVISKKVEENINTEEKANDTIEYNELK